MQKRHKTMKELICSEQPYEKCEQFGAGTLSDAELLAVIIRSGSKNQRAVEIAEEILNSCVEYPGLLGLHYMTITELQKINGIGKVKAIQLLCISELAKRLSSMKRIKGIAFTKPETVADYYMQELRCYPKEQLILLMLDTKNHLIKDEIISIGTVNASIAEPREIFLTAFKYSAVSIILVHNHPSGDPTPSNEDVHFTKRVKEVGELIGIALMDHIILGDNIYISFREQGFL